MSQVPSDSALLTATIDYLEAQLLPTLEGEHRFKTRLAVNALKALLRGQHGEANALSTDESQALSDQWARRIRNREVTLDDPGTLAFIETSLRQSLKVNNPKWLVN